MSPQGDALLLLVAILAVLALCWLIDYLHSRWAWRKAEEETDAEMDKLYGHEEQYRKWRESREHHRD